jgi:flagellar biosynthesis/type III secretory pathway protein FliH
VATEFSFDALEAPVAVPAASGADIAAGVLERAQAEAAALRASAQTEGFEQGRAEAAAALAPALQALEAAVAAVEAERLAASERLEAHAVDLALFLAEKVLGGALAVEPGRVVEAVRGALRAVVERERVTVLVNPADLDLVRDAMDGMRATLGGIEHCEVQAERRVTRGGAILRTQDGDVDARIETKLQRAREVVESALGGGAA